MYLCFQLVILIKDDYDDGIEDTTGQQDEKDGMSNSQILGYEICNQNLRNRTTAITDGSIMQQRGKEDLNLHLLLLLV
jgi:hypothetical protein